MKILFGSVCTTHHSGRVCLVFRDLLPPIRSARKRTGANETVRFSGTYYRTFGPTEELQVPKVSRCGRFIMSFKTRVQIGHSCLLRDNTFFWQKRSLREEEREDTGSWRFVNVPETGLISPLVKITDLVLEMEYFRVNIFEITSGLISWPNERFDIKEEDSLWNPRFPTIFQCHTQSCVLLVQRC